MFKFELGQQLYDEITGFSGIVVCRMEYLTGVNRYSLQSESCQDGKPLDWQAFDEITLRAGNDNKKIGFK